MWKILSLLWPNTLMFLHLLIALITISVVNVCALQGFILVSFVTNWVLLEEVCMPSLKVLNCWLNLVAGCFGDENELPLTVINLS